MRGLNPQINSDYDRNIFNKVAVVPLLVSTNSYGLLWDNYSYQKVNNKDSMDLLKWWCEDGDIIDFYFVSAKNPDGVKRGYRQLTGDAPMYGKWAYGYWQCKERYKTRDELFSTALQFRKLKFPIDNIVQDWQYWGDYGWSALLFDEKIFPKPKEMIDILHKNNFHFMISVWSVFGENSPVYKEMAEHDLLCMKMKMTITIMKKEFIPRSNLIGMITKRN
jgi:alpha-D-xyloside xylohydrolase